MPGEVNGFYAAFANDSGLFVAGTPFTKGASVLRAPALGADWVNEPLPFGAGVLKLTGDAKHVYAMVLKNGALGSGDSVARRNPATGQWSRVPGYPGESVVHIASAGSALFAIGDDGVVYRADDAGTAAKPKWATLKLPSRVMKPWSLDATGTDDVFVGGSERGQLFFAHFDGLRWAELAVEAPSTMLEGIACVGRGVAVAGAEPKDLYRLSRGEPAQVLKRVARDVCLVTPASPKRGRLCENASCTNRRCAPAECQAPIVALQLENV